MRYSILVSYEFPRFEIKTKCRRVNTRKEEKIKIYKLLLITGKRVSSRGTIRKHVPTKIGPQSIASYIPRRSLLTFSHPIFFQCSIFIVYSNTNSSLDYQCSDQYRRYLLGSLLLNISKGPDSKLI